VNCLLQVIDCIVLFALCFDESFNSVNYTKQIYISSINRNELMKEDECRMSWLLLSNTIINVQFADSSSEDISTNVGSPQGDVISGLFFNTAFEKSLRTLWGNLNTRRPTIEHSYTKITSLPRELIYADDTDFTAEDKKVNITSKVL